MNILFLAHRIPFPPDRGDKIRSYNVLKHLATLGAVHLASFADDAEDAGHLHALRAALGGALGEAHIEVRAVNRAAAAIRAFRTGSPLSVALFDSPTMRRFVADLVARERIDAVYIFSGQMAQYVPDTRARVLMDFVDMDSAKFADYGRGRGTLRWLHAREARTLLAFERETAARADASLFVTEAEAALFRRAANLPDVDIRAVCNGIDLAGYDPAIAPVEAGEGPLILFTGQMDYRPNVEAVETFARRVLPSIRAARPDARFAIVGRNPTRAIRRLAGGGVIVTSAVDDVRPWLARADVAVAPLAIARGVQNKVLEAMAMARPVVASPQAFEGIDATPGRDLIVAYDPAKPVLALLADPARAAEIGTAARRRMEARYRWSATLAPIAGLLDARTAIAAE